MSQSRGWITRSALLLLGKDEATHLLSPADAKMTWVLRDEHNRTVDSQHFSLPLLLSTEKLAGRIRNIMLEHMPDGLLFPTAVPRYDGWVLREALHNSIAHQDYRSFAGLRSGSRRQWLSKRYGQACRQDINALLLTKLPDVLSPTQKMNKIRNLMQVMRREALIHREGSRTNAAWRIK